MPMHLIWGRKDIEVAKYNSNLLVIKLI